MNKPLLNETEQSTSDSGTPQRERGESQTHLVDAEGLRQQLFEDRSRPSLAWVRRQTRAKTIPSIRVGRLIFYNVPAVREKLSRRNTVHAN